MIFRTSLAAAFAALLALASCRAPIDGPEVVVTIKPIHALVAGIMEGVGEPALLMDGMVSPHAYQMRPSDAGFLAGASLVVWVAPSIEGAMPAALEMLPGEARIVEVSTLEGLLLLPIRESGIRIGERDSDHQHTESLDSAWDAHVWLDPVNAIVITEAIAEELAAIDPPNAERYRQNSARQVEQLAALDEELRLALAPVRDVPFITFHDAFQYFEEAYGLTNVGSVAISPERAAGGRTVMELRELILSEGAVCVFAEPQFEPRLLNALTEGTVTRAGTLDPLGEEVFAGPDAYAQIMRNLADAIVLGVHRETGE